jgi:zinc protease
MINKSKAFLIAALSIAVSSTATAQTRLVEKVSRTGTELVIPYEKYVLANGLTLIIHEDHSDPLVHVDVTYHVGSAREEIGKSGFAHFFEHMMFQGSDNVGDEQHFKIVTESGGTLNGTTNRDRTNYFETLPSNQLEVALWLEADRMGFLLDAVTQQKFEVQRATVKNERGQNYDNRPYGLSREVLGKNMYPYGHPYSWLTIGYIEDLNRVDVNDLKRFFLRWYGPNNATVTVGGDVTPKEVIALVEKYFGSIPRGPEVSNMQPMPAVLSADRYVSYTDNYARLPMYMKAWPSVPTYHVDEVALDALAEMLGQGKSSLFYQNFDKKRKALQSSVFHPTSELAGEFSVQIIPGQGVTLREIDSLVAVSLKEFAATTISDEKIARFKADWESDRINSLQSVTGKVSQLAGYQTFTGNPNMLAEEFKKVQALTAADVRRVFETYILNKPGVIVSVLPKAGNVQPAQPDNYSVDTSGYTAPADAYAGLTYVKPKDNFDRSKKPASGPNPVIKVPPYWTAKLKNGIKVIGAANNEVPTVTVVVDFPGGQRLEPVAKAGLASLTGVMMNESTQNYSAEAFEDALKALGSSVSISADADGFSLRVFSLTKNLGATMKLAEERLLKPKFDSLDFVRNQQNTIKGLQNRLTQPAAVASDVYSKLLYGKDDIRAYPVGGTEGTVGAITLADVKAFYAGAISSNARVTVVGDVDQKTAVDALAFLNGVSVKGAKVPKFTVPAAPEKTKLYFVDIPKAAQSEIRIGYIALPFDATGAYYEAGLINYILGGSFNSRINLNLREDKGWTYGARSGFSGSDLAGPFTASAGVKQAATDSSVYEFINEIKLFREKGITAEELAFLKSSIGQRDARAYETGFQKAAFLSQIGRYNLPKNFLDKQTAMLNKLTADRIKALAQLHLKPDNAFIVVVGDKASVMPSLSRLGYEIVQLDAKGKPVASK